MVDELMSFNPTFCPPAGQPPVEVRCLSFSLDLFLCESLCYLLCWVILWKCFRPQEDRQNTPQVLYNTWFYDLICYPAIWVTGSVLFFFLLYLNEIVCFIVWSEMCPRCEIKYDTSIEAPAEVKKCQREVTEDSLKPHLSLFWSTLGQAVDVWVNAGKTNMATHN